MSQGQSKALAHCSWKQILPDIPVIQKSAADPAAAAAAFPEIHVNAYSNVGYILLFRSYAQQQVLPVAVFGVDISSSQAASKGFTQPFPLALTVFPVFRGMSVCIQDRTQNQTKP